MNAVAPLNIQRPLKLRSEDFALLSGGGALADYGKTELIDGSIVYMNAQHRPHLRAKKALYDVLNAALLDAGLSYTVFTEGSVAMPPHDVPEPDLIVTDEPDGDGFVPAASVKLVVEVADTTLSGDLGWKAALYARQGIPEYWVIDIGGRTIHQLWSPSSDGYLERRLRAFGDPIEPATLAGVSVPTARLV